MPDEHSDKIQQGLLPVVSKLIFGIVILVIGVITVLFLIFYNKLPYSKDKITHKDKGITKVQRNALSYWKSADLNNIADRSHKFQVEYGKELIVQADSRIQGILVENEEAFKKNIETIVGYSTIPLYRYFVVENPIDTMILNALHWQFPEVDVVLSNGFRFCPPRTTPDQTGNIPITNGFIFDMLPVDSVIRTAKVTGAQLKEWLEKELNNVFAKDASKRFGGWVVKFKGIEVSFNAFAEMGKRVQSVVFKGKPLQAEKLYSILACEREGEPDDMLCRMTNVKEAKNTTATLHTVMTAYLKQNSPVTPTPSKNARILDAPDALLTQVTGVDYKFL